MATLIDPWGNAVVMTPLMLVFMTYLVGGINAELFLALIVGIMMGLSFIINTAVGGIIIILYVAQAASLPVPSIDIGIWAGVGIGVCVSGVYNFLEINKRKSIAIDRFLDVLSPINMDHSADVESWSSFNPEVSDYRQRVADQGRMLLVGEYMAMKAWTDGRK